MKFASVFFFFSIDEDILKKTDLHLNPKTILIEHVEIDMEPSVGMFEEELCRLVNKDRMDKKKMAQTTVSALAQDALNKVSIVERRLRVKQTKKIFSQI